jgi:transposase
MKRIGEDVAEKLDYVPGVFTVERHIRGKWACAKCETLVQAPVDAHVIDKGIPTTGLLAQVLVAKFADHLPLYRQEAIFAGPAWPSRARPWRNGWAPAACSCSRWWMPSRPRNAQAQRAACGRDAGADAQAGQRQDAPGLPVGLCARGV